MSLKSLFGKIKTETRLKYCRTMKTVITLSALLKCEVIRRAKHLLPAEVCGG